MKKFLYSFFLFGIFSALSAKAFCPVCTVAVGAGVGLAQWLGIDDSITGLWIGGLSVSLIAWTINWLNKKNINFFGKKIVVIIAYYALTIVPLFFTNILGHPLNKLWGIDKLLLGIILGSVLFYIGGTWYAHLKEKNGGRAHFPFQKVVMPLTPLVILSIVFYFLIK